MNANLDCCSFCDKPKDGENTHLQVPGTAFSICTRCKKLVLETYSATSASKIACRKCRTLSYSGISAAHLCEECIPEIRAALNGKS
jgi:hypothetical protein